MYVNAAYFFHCQLFAFYIFKDIDDIAIIKKYKIWIEEASRW